MFGNRVYYKMYNYYKMLFSSYCMDLLLFFYVKLEDGIFKLIMNVIHMSVNASS